MKRTTGGRGVVTLAAMLAIVLLGLTLTSGIPRATELLAADGGQAPTDVAARLGTTLTPVGAEAAGNADGSIPAYTGGLPKSDPINPKVGYADPFAEDLPLFTVTAANAAQYANVLSAGHQALLKRDARTFHMKVYPTRRSASYPADVLAEVKARAGQSATDGFHVKVAGRTTVPFPVPADGLQVMWNHVYRWRGGSVERQYAFMPVQPSGVFFVVRHHQTIAFDHHGYMELKDSRPGRLYNATSFYLSPPSAVGLRAVTWEPTDPVSEQRARWMFIPATLDTRRVPAYEYDTQEPYTVGMRAADQYDGWNGTPDAYDWKLVGKRELLIGYNAYRLANRTLPYGAIIRPHNLDAELLRYERHRVWVVEATQRKPHKYHRRVFYVDEDTWQVAQEEVYDKKGRLVRFGDHHMMQFYDVQVPWYGVTLHHIIGSGAYIATYLNNMEPFPTRWGFKGQLVDFLPSRLRTLGLR